MSLRLDTTKCENFESFDPRENELMAFLLMTAGMTSITSKNWKDVYIRVHAKELVYGPLRIDGEFITPAFIQKYIGASSNVPTVTTATFKTQLWEGCQNEAYRELRKAGVNV